jgi:hypothetical protein
MARSGKLELGRFSVLAHKLGLLEGPAVVAGLGLTVGVIGALERTTVGLEEGEVGAGEGVVGAGEGVVGSLVGNSVGKLVVGAVGAEGAGLGAEEGM